jgi:outer membrane receptor protein involved in Fe transport
MPVDQPPIQTAPPPIVVRAARLPPAPGDLAFSIIRLDATALAVSERLDDALGAAPGFSLYRRTSSLGANPTTQGVSLRGIAGSGASRALVTLDGVPQNDPFGGWVIWTSLPPEAISGVSLVRGAGAGPYGAGALTGVVALEQPSQIDGGAAGDVEAGDHGYGRAAAITEIDTGPARVFLDASGETSGGWIPVIAGRGSVDRPLTLHDWSAAERAEIDLGSAVLSERIAGYDEIRGAGTLHANSAAQGIQASATLVDQPAASAVGWRLQGWIDGSNLTNSSASVSANRDIATLADNQYATPALGGGLNAALRRETTAYSWEVGVDVRDMDGESRERLYNQGAFTGDRTSGGGETVAGVYAEGSRDLGPWLLTGGLRLDGWADYASKLVQTGSAPLDQHTADRGGAVPTGRLGVRRDLSRDLYVRAAAYAGFRPATLNELHRPYRVGNDVTEANPALTPERLYGAEVGLGGDRRVKWDADLFFNQLANAVTNVTIGKGPASFPLAGYVPAGGVLFERENAGSINAHGAEGDASTALGVGLEVRAAFSYTHARVDGGAQAPQLTGLRPALTPTTTVTAGLDWRATARLTLTAQARYESDRFDDDQNTRLIKGGAGVDGRAAWRVSKTLSAYVAADNLFNARPQTGRSATDVVTHDAPRLVRIGLSLRR